MASTTRTATSRSRTGVQQKTSAESFATIFVAVNAPAWQMICKQRVEACETRQTRVAISQSGRRPQAKGRAGNRRQGVKAPPPRPCRKEQPNGQALRSKLPQMQQEVPCPSRGPALRRDQVAVPLLPAR